MTKSIFALMAILSFSATASLAKVKSPQTENKKICAQLESKIEDDCAHIMCDDGIADGTFKDISECVGGSDYAEAAQAACEDQPTLEDLVKEYNKKHASAKISCE